MSNPGKKDPYEDLYMLPHPDSRTHPRMDPIARAAQFSPFAALTGYEDRIAESAQEYLEQKESEIRYVPFTEGDDI
ncbi:MAG: hypothetical protein K6E92_03620 [Lachnospiraceae bacterium]|nr:hypothetical protein [Lachnospiraceae bacterium]